MIRFRTLGAVGLSHREGPELRAVLAQPKRLALLTYLALARPRGSHRRDRLLAMFWPDSGDERARATLNRAIYFLRRKLGDGVIVSQGDEELAIDTSQFWCDAVEFEALLDRGKLREAIELYHGDLLPGFFTSDANGFEDWLEREREYLRDRAALAAASLAEAEESNGSLPLAVHWARRSVELSPFNELGLRRLLVILDAAGDRGGAEEAYQKFSARMSSELEVTPAPETRALIERIRGRDRPATEVAEVVPARDASPVVAAHPRPVPATVFPLGARRRRWPIAAAVAATLVAITTPAALLARANWRHLDTHRVLVARFTNLTGDSTFDMLGRVASDRIVQSLTATGMVDVVDPGAVRVAPPALTASNRQAGAAEEAARHRAGTVVTGEIHRDGSQLVVQAWVGDVAQGRVVWAIPGLAVSPESITTAIEETRERVTGAVAALNTERFASWFPAATSPPRFQAFQEFAQGVELQLRGADSDAMPHLRRAVELDPSFTWGQLQLAQGHLSIFEENRADSIAAALNLHRERLTPLQRHWLDWMLSLRAEDPLAGYRAISKAAAIAPERFLLTLASCAERLNRPREAAALLERLGAESPYHRETEYWALLSRSYHALGDRTRELATARAARVRYPDRIDVLSLELSARAANGQMHTVRALLDTALAFPRPKVRAGNVIADMPGHAHAPGRLMVQTAVELRAHGLSKEADEILRRAIAWYETQTPTAAALETHRKELAKALYLARDWSAAEAVYRSLVAADTTDNFVYTGFLGTIAARKGDSTTARRVLARFDTLRPTFARPNAFAGYWQSKISVLLGDEAGAMQKLSETFGPQGRNGGHNDFDFESIWRSRQYREFVRPKG